MLTDSEKLRKLADWIDFKYPNDLQPEVQSDLRRIANKLEHSLLPCFAGLICEENGILELLDDEEERRLLEVNNSDLLDAYKALAEYSRIGE